MLTDDSTGTNGEVLEEERVYRDLQIRKKIAAVEDISGARHPWRSRARRQNQNRLFVRQDQPAKFAPVGKVVAELADLIAHGVLRGTNLDAKVRRAFQVAFYRRTDYDADIRKAVPGPAANSKSAM